MDEADERTLLRILARTEVVHTALTVALCGLLLAACVLLWRNTSRVEEVHAQLVERNRQGGMALQLLDEAVRKLEARR